MTSVPVTGRLKTAADKSLENTLAQLAYAKLSDRAPELFNYVKGFQLLDQSEDRTRATGMFGFDIAGKIMRVPIFYKDGQIFGTEIIMPEPKKFRPLSDQWVRELTASSPDNAGEKVPANKAPQIGTSLWQLATPPTKWAQAPADIGEFASAVSGHDSELPSVDFVKLASSDPVLASCVLDTANAYPQFREAVTRFYGGDAWDAIEAGKAAGLFAKKAVATPKLKGESKAKLVVIRSISIKSMKFPEGLSIGEKADLSAGNNVYRDNRGDDEVAEVVQRTAELATTNPGRTGLYELRMPGGGVVEAFVARIPLGFDENVKTRSDRSLAVRLSDGAAKLVHPSRMFAYVRPVAPGQYGLTKMRDKGKKIEKVTDLPDGQFILVFHDDSVSVPLSVIGSPQDGIAHVRACCGADDWEDGFDWSELRNRHNGEDNTAPNFPTSYDGQKWRRRHDRPRKNYDPKIVVVPHTASPVVSGSTMLVPSGTIAVPVKESYGIDAFDPRWDNSPGTFGTSFVPEVVVTKKASGEYTYIDPRKPKRVFSYETPSEIEADLVERVHLRPSVARDAVKSAQAGKPVRLPVKFSASLLTSLVDDPGPQVQIPFVRSEQSASPVPGLTYQFPASAESVATTGNPYQLYDRADPANSYLKALDASPGAGPANQGDMQPAVRAYGEGAKDLFGSSALAAIIKHTRVDTHVERLTQTMLSQIDWLGRTLAVIYANPEGYAERYGQSELGELTDRVRSMFESLGDLYLKLKEQDTSRDNSDDSAMIPDDDSQQASD